MNDAHDARIVLVLGMAASSWPTGLKDAHDARAAANDAHDSRRAPRPGSWDGCQLLGPQG